MFRKSCGEEEESGGKKKYQGGPPLNLSKQPPIQLKSAKIEKKYVFDYYFSTNMM